MIKLFKTQILLTLAIITFSAKIALAQAIPPAISPSTSPDRLKAPEWVIEKWVVGPPTSLEKLSGKVIVLDFFQLWCPGCNSFSIPLVERWKSKYAKQTAAGKIAFVSIHTVFEGHTYQNNAKLAKFVKTKNMHHPVGVDARKKGARIPITMDHYKTYGTPEMAIIDKKGFIRFQKFGGFEPPAIEKLIETLMAEDLSS